MSDYPMLISNKLHSFRNFRLQIYKLLKAIHNAKFIPALSSIVVSDYKDTNF